MIICIEPFLGAMTVERSFSTIRFSLIEWSFLTNPFTNLWTIIPTIVFYDFWWTFTKDPFSRVILVCDRSVFQRFLCCSDERSFLHTPVDNLSTISSDSFWKIVFNDPILRSSNDRVTKNAWCDCSAIISRDPLLRSVYDPVLQALTDHIKRR